MSPEDCARLRLTPPAGLKSGRLLIQCRQVGNSSCRWSGPDEKWTSRIGAGRKEVGTLRTDVILVEAGQSKKE